jgi:chromate transporter
VDAEPTRADEPASPGADPARGRLRELALLFLRLGTTAFGGPAAHIALMEQEVVRRRRWMEREEFLDLVSAANLVPGPNSTELAIHIGRMRAGWPGLLVAGACFILPAALIVGGLAALYVELGAVPEARSVFRTVMPVMIAIVAHALVGFARTAVKSWPLALLLGVAGAASFAGAHELVVLLAAGAAGAGARAARRGSARAVWLPLALGPAPLAASAFAFDLGRLFLFFLKVGSVLFGSGYVLLAFLRADLVERWGWLTSAQLLDAIAVGQMTPGPVFTTATFIGYILAGPLGAAVATVGIFLPAFLFVAASGWLIPRMRRSPIASGFLDGVNVASLALMALVTWQLAGTALVDAPTVVLAAASALLIWRYPRSSTWLILGAAAGGLGIELLDRLV